MTLEEKTAGLLIQKQKTVALAESCSGGLLANRLTNIPGSSRFLKLGLVTYSNDAKIKLLKIPPVLLQRHGAVSQAVAVTMAQSVRRILKTDLGVSITGIAGPSGETRTKPVGLTYIALAFENEWICLKCHLRGERKKIKSQATDYALKLIYEFLTKFIA